jgi:hypothetical protein
VLGAAREADLVGLERPSYEPKESILNEVALHEMLRLVCDLRGGLTAASASGATQAEVRAITSRSVGSERAGA